MDTMNDFIYASAPTDGFVGLSRTPKGKLFKKHILSTGTLHYPGVAGGKLEVDEAFLSNLVKNFDDKVCDIVQVPVANKLNEHTEDPFANIGEVVKLGVENGKLYSYIDVRKNAEDVGNTLLGASAMLSTNYTDTRDGEKKGPTLLHVAVTNRPHVLNLEDFQEELLAASAEGNTAEAVLLTANEQEKAMPTIDELIATLSSEHGIDVLALQKKVAEAEDAVTLSAGLSDALSKADVISLSAGATASAEDILGAVVKVAQSNIQLSGEVAALSASAKEAAAEARIESLVKDGFITPAKRDAHKALLLSNPESFDAIIPEKPIVALSAESGFLTVDPAHETVVEQEIARLSGLFDDKIVTA